MMIDGDAPGAGPSTTLKSGSWLLPVVIVVAGLVVGIATQILQGVLPDGWGVLANSGVMWALAAFALGAAMPTTRWAVGGGAAQLVIAAVSYYVAVDVFENAGTNARATLIWSVAGVIAGSVFGLAGYWFSHHRTWRYPSLSLVGGVLIGEGIHLAWFVGNTALRPAGFIELTIGIALAILCVVRAGSRSVILSVIAAASIGAAGTLAAGQIIDAVFGAS